MKFTRLTGAEQVAELIERINRSQPYTVLDLETTGLDPFRDQILEIALSFGPDQAFIFDAQYADLLRGLNVLLVLQNFKFDFQMLYRRCIDLRQKPVRDTMLLHHLYNENLGHSLDEMVQEFYQDDYKTQFWAKYKKYEEAPAHEQLEYAGKDVCFTHLLYGDLCRRLEDDGISEPLIEHTHHLALALLDSELWGVKIDVEYLTEKGAELQAHIQSLRQQMREGYRSPVEVIEYEMWEVEIAKRKTPAGKARVKKPLFSFDSTKQVGELLYGKLGLPKQYNEKSKRLSIDDASLEKLKDLHPIVPLIQVYRGYQKTFGAFIEGTLERMYEGRIYPSFHVAGTVTGRISSSNPNMQQLPREGGIRGIYIPDPGWRIVTCDYAQLEVVVAAHFSLDPNLLKIIHEGVSQHDITAEGLGIERHLAKTINFAMQYGATEYKIGKILKCSDQEAKSVLKRYWQTYAGVKRVMDECHLKVKNGLPIVNPFGRKRRFPRHFKTHWEEQRALRQSFSSLIQGTGSDLTHRAFYSIARELKQRGWGHALFEVHDEIVIQAPERYAVVASQLLEKVMVDIGQSVNFRVPLKVQCSAPLDRWEK